MKSLVRRTVGLALVAACAFSTVPRAEEAGFDPEGDPIPVYQGPAFFGFVKDAKGSFVPDAMVTLAARGRAPVIVRTNSVGIYRASFGKDVDANDVVISCAKAGFKQMQVLRRTDQAARADTPIEIECTLTADTAY